MLCSENAHIILTSSHKVGQDSRDYINMESLRKSEILINNSIQICPNHSLAMLNPEITASNCICYLFHQPRHIISNASYRRILTAFSSAIQSKYQSRKEIFEEQQCSINTKSAMLSEIGILPPNISVLNNINDNEIRTLATISGCNRFYSNFIDVNKYISINNPSLLFDKKIIIYIDPAPLNVFRSSHAICFIATASSLKEININNNNIDDTITYNNNNNLKQNYLKSVHYVILAVEEFNTTDINNDTGDCMKAIAQVFMSTINIITIKYDAYFTDFIVVPEANDVSVDDFWTNCKYLYKQYDMLIKNNIAIFTTVIDVKINSENSDTDNALSLQKYNKFSRVQRYQLFSPRATELDSIIKINEIKKQEEKKIRIGYILGGHKVKKFYYFFSNIFNICVTNYEIISCANHIWSFTLYKRKKSIPDYIVQKLKLLEIRPIVHYQSGKISYKISGKGGNKSSGYIQDDLPTAIVMSTMINHDIRNNKLKNDILKLSPL